MPDTEVQDMDVDDEWHGTGAIHDTDDKENQFQMPNIEAQDMDYEEEWHGTGEIQTAHHDADDTDDAAQEWDSSPDISDDEVDCLDPH
jgi:hypothetical protein